MRREGVNNEILPSVQYRWPEGTFTMHRGEREESLGGRACSWNAAYVNPLDFS